jgi:hypothetical protein
MCTSSSRSASALACAACAGCAALSASLPAEAAPRGGTVTACSRYGNGCYTAPVRPSPLGPQMLLKGGTWIDCEGSCKDTLREKTVDFWETLRERGGGRR